MPCYKECGICDVVGPYAHMSLLYEFYGLHTFMRQTTQHHKHKLRTALTVSAIFNVTIITASRLRQNAATVSLFSTSLSFADVFSTPMSYSFASTCDSMRARKGS